MNLRDLHPNDHITITRGEDTISGRLTGFNCERIDVSHPGGPTNYLPGRVTLSLAPWNIDVQIGPGDTISYHEDN